MSLHAKWRLRQLKAALLRRPAICDVGETLDMLATTGRSIARFGDGEVMLMNGRGILFQEHSRELAERLRDVAENPPAECALAFSRSWWYRDGLVQPHIEEYARKLVKTYGDAIDAMVAEGRTYYDTAMTQFYQSFKPGFDFAAMFAKARRIWHGKDVLLVCGESVRAKLEHDIFDNCASMSVVDAPSRNAWSRYESIKADVASAASGRLVLAILGPTATVLAADLCRVGIRALDIGHIAKDYDAFLRKLPTDMAANVQFYMPETDQP